MKPIILITTLILASFALGACNTMQGVGADLQAAGRKLERSAEENKPKGTTQPAGTYTAHPSN